MAPRTRMVRRLGSVMLAGLASSQMAFNCGGHVGDPCIPEDEYRGDFKGFSEREINVESRSLQCETRVCLVANFRGRVSCPYGQGADPSDPSRVDPGLADADHCAIPGTSSEDDAARVTVPVEPGLVARRPQDAVYCSCRCDGPDPSARYCDCPSGFECVELISDIGLLDGQLAGSYCVKEGSVERDPQELAAGAECDAAQANCGPTTR